MRSCISVALRSHHRLWEEEYELADEDTKLMEKYNDSLVSMSVRSLQIWSFGSVYISDKRIWQHLERGIDNHI